ncbi:MAG: bifunctional folylpolyglutamate synthase/dihydrofolate synthase [Prolixibacteraceae bacterium]|nr:bifunctional folylpolyglutamate synthase/dihydrofolate synthase [Prolixibacteraceae bacterium]
MDYSKTLQYLFGQLPMFQRSGPAAYKANLDNTLALDVLFQHPHRMFRTIHVAGTNGKGSVSHWLASVLQSAGYKTGLYTSPHLVDYRERIRVNGEMISEAAVSNFVERFLDMNRELNIEPSFFELSVMMAFDFFAAQQVDVAVIEVGLGGRLDSTNIITPDLSVITNISLDHTNLLGTTIAAIAAEKAGIIKAGVPVIIGESHPESEPVFRAKARELGAPLEMADQQYLLLPGNQFGLSLTNECVVLYRDLVPGLSGHYQQKNLVTVLAAIQVLRKKYEKITEAAVREGIEQVVTMTGLRGRWEQISEQPRIICDTGHNEAGLDDVVRQLASESFSQLHFVFGTVNDKDINAILALLPKNARYYFTQAGIERALDANQLQALAVPFGLRGTVHQTVREALAAARSNAKPNDLIFVGGSTFVVAEIINE